MLDLSKYDNKQWHDKDYNCLHFAVDIYRDITGKDMGIYVAGLLTSRDLRTINPAKLKEFEPLDEPVEPCLALMHGAELHAGIYHLAKIIHITETGVQCVPPHIAALRHGRVKYYAI